MTLSMSQVPFLFGLQGSDNKSLQRDVVNLIAGIDLAVLGAQLTITTKNKCSDCAVKQPIQDSIKEAVKVRSSLASLKNPEVNHNMGIVLGDLQSAVELYKVYDASGEGSDFTAKDKEKYTKIKAACQHAVKILRQIQAFLEHEAKKPAAGAASGAGSVASTGATAATPSAPTAPSYWMAPSWLNETHAQPAPAQQQPTPTPSWVIWAGAAGGAVILGLLVYMIAKD